MEATERPVRQTMKVKVEAELERTRDSLLSAYRSLAAEIEKRITEIEDPFKISREVQYKRAFNDFP